MLNGKLTVVANHAGLQICNSGALGWNKRATGHVANHGGFEQEGKELADLRAGAGEGVFA